MIGTSIIHHTDTFRSPLRPRQPVPYPSPRDLPASLEYDFPASSASRFPISSIRQDAPKVASAKPPAHPPKPIYPRHDPLHILSQTPPPPPRSYPSVVPAPSVAPGVLADGVLTSKLPSVRQFLDAATIAPPECPPWPSDRRVLALVALSVFYHPLHPAHWAFWNKEQRKATAHMIQSVLDTTPTPILSPIGWMAVPENLWILSSVQSAYGSALASLPWYATYTPAEPESRMSLRKRKPLAILASAANGACGDETADEDERITPPPRKRAKTRRSTASRSKEARAKSAASGEPADEENKQGDRPRAPEAAEAALLLTADVPTLTKAAKRERIESPEIATSTNVVDGSVRLDAPDVDEAPELRKSLRQRERKAKATSSGSPASIASTLTPSVRACGLSQARTPSRESSAVTPESIGVGESGSSTAVSLSDEEATKSKASKTVEEVIDEEDAEEDDAEGPVTKRARTTRPRAKASSRSRSTTKNKMDTVTDDAKTNMTAQARPKARSRAKTRRR